MLLLVILEGYILSKILDVMLEKNMCVGFSVMDIEREVYVDN